MPQLYSITIIICILIFTTTVSPLKPKQTGFVPGSIATFQENASESIISYFDVDRDGKIDILTKCSWLNGSATKTTLNLYVWNAKLKQYSMQASYPVPQHLTTVYITSFHVFENFALAMYLTNSSQTAISFLTFTCKNQECLFGEPLTVPELAIVDPIQPSLLVIEGQIGLSFHKNGQAQVIFFTNNETIQYSISLLKDLVRNGQTISNFRYIYNGDYDGDCLTDLVLLKTNTDPSQTNTLQFLRGNSLNQYQFVYQAVFSENIRHFTIQDINYDGKNDLILLLDSNIIQIHYHHHHVGLVATPLCEGMDSQLSPYDFRILNEHSIFYIQQLQFDRKVSKDSLLLFGDYNNDGFDDLALSFEGQGGQNKAVGLLQNIACHGQECGSYNKPFILQSLTSNIRTFKKQPTLGLVGESYSLSFLDFYQDGNLDFIYHSMRTTSRGDLYTVIQAVYNNLDYDAFFLQITILNAKTTSTEHNTQYIGGVASFYVTAISGQLTPKTANQLPQTGAILALPSIRLGLGRTNNYLEQLVITVPRSSFSQFRWSPIIPNSQIMIMSAWGQFLQWQLKVMIEPTEKMGFVLVIVILSLGVLGMVIVRLGRKQREQDKESQQSFYTLLR